MTEIRLLIDEINYNDAAEYLLPIIKEKLVQKGNLLSLVKYVSESTFCHLASEFLQNLSLEQKENLAVQLINRYKVNIVNMIRDTAAGKGIQMTITDLSAEIVPAVPDDSSYA